MLYKYFAVLAIVFLLIPTLNAQDVDRSGGYARVRALGSNPYVVDPEFMKVNPAWGQFYDNFLWGDIGSNSGTPFGDESSGQFFGLNFRLDDAWTLGALMTRRDFNSSSIALADPFGLTGFELDYNAVPLNNNLELFSSVQLGNTSIGLGIAYASTNSEDNPASGGSSTATASQFGINAGVLANFSRTMMLDLGVSFVMPSVTSEPEGGPNTDISQTIIGANARFFWKLSNKVRLVPALQLINATGTYDAGTSRDLPSLMVLGVGVGLEYTVGDFMFIGGPAFTTSSTTYASVPENNPEYTESETTFPGWNLGAEWTATEWLIARMGYTASTGTETEESPASLTTVNEQIRTVYSEGMMTLGVGFRFGGFGLDATVNSDVLRQGLGNIGGGATFAYLSASYGF